MTADIRFYRDQEQQPRIQAGPDHTSLADYLASDLQEAETSGEILKRLKTKNYGGEKEINGNSYTVILEPELITLENMFDEEMSPYQIPVDNFVKILSSWIDFLENPGILSLVADIK